MKEINELQCFRKHRLRKIFDGMKARCYNPNSSGYKYYGGKGIKICREWDRFEVFSEWAINNGYTNNLTIDRIDSSKNYSPDNCQWLTRGDNCFKRSSTVKKEDLETFKTNIRLERIELKLNKTAEIQRYFDRLKELKNKYGLKTRKYVPQSKC